MSDPRDEMRRILHRPSEQKPEHHTQRSSDWLDAGLDFAEHLSVGRDNDPIVVKCLGGLMKVANDALDAAVSSLDD